MLKSELRKTYKGLKKKRNIQKVLYIAMNLRNMKRKKIFHLSSFNFTIWKYGRSYNNI